MLGKIFEEILGFIKAFFEKEEAVLLVFILIVGGFFVFNFFSPSAGGYALAILFSLIRFFALTWWLWLFFLMLPFVWSLWRYWRVNLWGKTLHEVILEIKIPGQNLRDPKAMEQVFIALNALRDSFFDPWERHFKGVAVREYSLEIMSFGGDVHFYMVMPKKEKDIFKSVFFAHYPDVDIEEVSEDYMERLPKDGLDMWKRDYRLWGSELVMNRPAMYPIKTYPYFFEEIKEEKRIDPISAFLSLASIMRPGEIFGVQMIICPLTRDWAEEFEEELNKLKERKKEEKPGAEGDPSSMMFSIRSPGETEVLKAVEANLSKPAFETMIRFLYVAPAKIYNESAVYKGVNAALKQYDTVGMNSFRHNYAAMTKTSFMYWPHIFSKTQVELRRQRLLFNFRRRNTYSGSFVGRWLTSRWLSPYNIANGFPLNVEALATFFHIPTSGILTAPQMQRVESRKTGPPSGLEIFGEEEDIRKYQ